LYSLILSQLEEDDDCLLPAYDAELVELPESFQTTTVPSKEHDARIEPNWGWAHETCQTGPLCPVRVAFKTGSFPGSTEKTRTDRSELAVAKASP
jgi:hypothetical protein